MLKSANELCLSFLHVCTAIEFTDFTAESIFHGVERCIFHIFLICFSYNICKDLEKLTLNNDHFFPSLQCVEQHQVVRVARWF